MIKNAGARLGTIALRTIEVESKFTPTPSSIQLLRNNRGDPHFQSLSSSQSTTFLDEYYDFRRLLEQQGIWVRKREGQWEAKRRTGGNHLDSAFEEVAGQEGVAQVVARALRASDLRETLSLHQLKRTAMFTTTRLEWLANGRFQIVIDSTDFGHQIGEVELTQQFSPEEEGGLDAEHRLSTVLRSDLDQFMARHPWAFPYKDQKPVCKLSAYFSRFPEALD